MQTLEANHQLTLVQGTGVLGDSADGMHSSDTIFYDNKPDEIDRLLEDGAIHRAIDQNILSHAKKWHQEQNESKTQIRIMVPPLIFGKGSGPFKDISVQIPSLIRASKDVKYAAMHGEVIFIQLAFIKSR